MQIAILSLHSSPYGALGTADTGGMSIYIRETARHMAAAGHCVDIFTRRTRSDQPQVVKVQDRLRLIHLAAGPPAPIPKLELVDYQDDCCATIEQFRQTHDFFYDLIHSHYWISARLGQQLSLRWGVPHLVTFHTLAAVKDHTGAGRPEPALRIESEKQSAHQCNRVLVATTREKASMQRFYDVPEKSIEVVPGGVNLVLFQPQDRSKARRQLDIPTDDRVVLYVGRFDAMKGIDRVIEAIALLKTRSPVRLLLVGGDGSNSPARIRLQNLANRLGIEQSVCFAGRIEHERMPQVYSAADVAVVASHYESFGLVALEALACGTPVVATRVGAMDLVVNRNNGFLVDSASAPVLAAGISHCLSDAFRKAISVADIRSSVADYDWSRTAAGLLESYARLE